MFLSSKNHLESIIFDEEGYSQVLPYFSTPPTSYSSMINELVLKVDVNCQLSG